MLVMMISKEVTLTSVLCPFLISLNYLEHFPVDPAIVPNNATGHPLVTLCRSIGADEGEHKFRIR